MAKYTLCGATGATGRAILHHLLSNPPQPQQSFQDQEPFTLNIFLRNKQKLLTQFPTLESSPPFTTEIFSGSNKDTAIWKQALSNTDVILMCIATNDSTKGMTLFSDTAHAVITALRELKSEQGKEYKTPTILILRAITLNKIFNPTLDKPAILFFALRYLYDAMMESNQLYETAAKENPGLLDIVYVDPPAIHDEEGLGGPTGYRLDVEPPTQKGAADVRHDVSYADLGVAYCEIARRREEFLGKGVVITATGQVRTTWGRNISGLVSGMVGRVWG
ncbi:hypothetical protein CKM354_001100700 [Cercospora kikuchii]|uniref:NAD(P)-binding domain-containing protein n=1 Tax=Cercospora kikuchii TaxID=84275 RepID=A0A9P3CUQ2_9PEZI|nr:uncharacterized protein CKM354_001100700 [Cercospora kikuchii]GIZ47932.1 hypothetical protein CKM354_001100700 [Cercospora kikuchii]